jgi:hypothetical protein
MTIANNSIALQILDMQNQKPPVSDAGISFAQSENLKFSNQGRQTSPSNVNFTALVLKIGSFMTGFQAIFTGGMALATFKRSREFCSPITAFTASELKALIERMTSILPDIKNIPEFDVEFMSRHFCDVYSKELKLFVVTSVVLATASIFLMLGASAISKNSPNGSSVK